MYVPSHFDEPRTEVLHQMIASHPFGVLVSHGAGGLDANHLPFHLDPAQGALGTLHAHVARANPLWRALADGDEVMVIFSAGDAYISPNWYPSKHEAHQQVPTWNYMVAHAHGRIVIRDDERYVRGVVGRLTRTHEAAQPAPWKMSDAPADYIDTMLKAIVGIEIEITRLAGKRKLGQNKDVRDIRGAGEALSANGSHAVGDAMLDEAAAREK
ncbi:MULTISPECIES: FMN-binding negative transcriptional regulator [unclassified Herbaspirillum]|uniref:FMN-binding negative transcriptional regulator n=1 Tax=unclassified Herbaspirillum TaxID=2624150 RepID=UPI0011514DEB|nr:MULTISPECIES: FMN-binding negative transcriptional regulator [unclassified Herbaspirillum]MBB5390036.1 transcriptional regulator [Herbaspirillum sp. SJZ102]TQK09462.1 PaiB family negative transcriptional regulator [Herbaspirillum sp. SJZ130]TQK13851.1 PaiB family negative transcriptional regulator [Herbaspirillum sp. SJZ106]TWC69574.1 PaiB family negative transcriptional regulator [Herbaspirillum sp. SJZ099]